jgi:tetratricopeptide (TPR) repeat protein
MNHLNDLPKRHKNHTIESKAEAAFENCLSASYDFIIQIRDRKDYGTDYQIEVIDRDHATNVRIHVQLKGTQKPLNADGSVSIDIERSNFNYLLVNPHSFYICFHIPTDSLRICFADTILRQYEHSGKNWSEQKTLTVTFSEPLTDQRLKSLANLAKLSADSSRNMRVIQSAAQAKDFSAIVKKTLPELYVPEDEKLAADRLASLYDGGADEIISAAFEKFESVLGSDHDAMGFCYMAETNLGMAGKSSALQRIHAGIAHHTAKIKTGRYHIGSLYYTIGNGLSALGKDKQAIIKYEKALKSLLKLGDTGLLAQCYKNLGSSFEKLGQREKAARYYHTALRFSAHLAEAHNALGNFYTRKGRYEDALNHFDKVVYPDDTLGKMSSITGWRINVLFNIKDSKGAFREINSLLSHADRFDWIWPWCIRQVASFGRTSVESALSSMAFWNTYLRSHPECPHGTRELLLAKLYLRLHGHDIGVSYGQFVEEFEARIGQAQADDAAHLWDRLGHWAQNEENWTEAERCFRKAYDLEGGHYGYCLGVALNCLGRWDESLPILISQAEEIQPDAMSWFQVAAACSHLGRISESIDAYRTAISLDENYALAWFNLAGVHWNSGDWEEASRLWKTAIEMFPEHELTSKLRNDLPFLFL